MPNGVCGAHSGRDACREKVPHLRRRVRRLINGTQQDVNCPLQPRLDDAKTEKYAMKTSVFRGPALFPLPPSGGPSTPPRQHPSRSRRAWGERRCRTHPHTILAAAANDAAALTPTVRRRFSVLEHEIGRTSSHHDLPWCGPSDRAVFFFHVLKRSFILVSISSSRMIELSLNVFSRDHL